MEKNFNELDKIYRVSEKEEIKKYLELGKTPAQYYAEQAARLDEQTEQKGESSIAGVRETLLSREIDDGLEISLIQGTSKSGKTFEQVKVSVDQGSVPDPRIAGAQIFFDSRLDMTSQSTSTDQFLASMRQPEIPSYARGRERRSDVKDSFNQDTEALYDPSDHGEFLSSLDREKRAKLQTTVECYNLIMGHINKKPWTS